MKQIRALVDREGRPVRLAWVGAERSGDVILLRLRGDVPGGLAGAEPAWDERTAVCVVLASRGYPESASTGDPISGLDAVPPGVEVFHAGTAERDGQVVTAGGRVLNVTGLGVTASEARARAYDAVHKVRFHGSQHRDDIAARVAERVPG